MYSSLHNHTYYSLLDGYNSPKEMLEQAQSCGIKSFAVTDHGQMYSFVYFDKLKKDFPDMKIIYGVEMYECDDVSIKDKDNKYYHLVVLIKDDEGRKILNRIVTKSNFDGFYYKPRIELKDFEGVGEHFVVSSACLASKLSREESYDKCIEYVNEYKKVFPNFYLEMQSHRSEEQVEYNKKILKLSQDTGVPYIITTDSHYAKKEDAYGQSYWVSIGRRQKGNNTRDALEINEAYEDCYIQTEEEIHIIMDSSIGKNNVDIGLNNTNIIADMIEEISMPFQAPQLPPYPIPEGCESEEKYIWKLIKDGWEYRGLNGIKNESEYRERVEYEMSIISQMGFIGYFLYEYEMTAYAHDNNMPVGAGRGSAAGSLVCYLLRITNIDPIKYGLIFERFLNPLRVSLPDVDTDFGNRSKVIEYLTTKYGKNKVAQIANFNYESPLMAIQDACSICDIPVKVARKIGEMFQEKTFEACLEKHSNVYEIYPEYTDMFNIAKRLSGRVRGVGNHAGGVCIAATTLDDYYACKANEDGEQVLQVDKKMVEEIGLVKYDALGVETLNIIYDAVNSAGITLWDIDINNPKFENDTASYEMISRGETEAVFQLESAGMTDLCLKLKPKNISEWSDVVALYRPDSMGYIDEYVSAKVDGKKSSYIHEDMAPILDVTFGAMLYQEQLMDIVRKFGGRNYGGADNYRKAIGKKNLELVKSESVKLYQEIIDTGYSEKIAKHLSDELAEKGGYMFNKSHSVSYAILGLQTAYLKCHYPLHYIKALLTSSINNNGKLNKYLSLAKKMNVNVLQPNINHSQLEFTVVGNSILFGLSAVNGIGDTVAKAIIEEREANGKYKNLKDLTNRVKLSKSQVVMLIKSGAIPSKDKELTMTNYCKSLYEPREFKQLKTVTGTLSYLKETYGIDTKNKEERLRLYNIAKEKEHNQKEKLRFEKHMSTFKDDYMLEKEFWEFEALSLFIDKNPFDDIYDYVTPFEDVSNGEQAVVVGVIAHIQKKKDKNNKPFCFMNIYSVFGILEVCVWSSAYEKYSSLIVKGNKVAILADKKEDKAYLVNVKSYNDWLNSRKKKGD